MAKPLPRSFAQAVGNFANGTDTPRDFLERCIAEIETREPQVKAFTAMRLDAARKAADASTKRWHKGAPLSYIDGMPIGIKQAPLFLVRPSQLSSPPRGPVRPAIPMTRHARPAVHPAVLQQVWVAG